MLYEIPPLKHVDAQTVEEAVYWLREYGDRAKVIAGGTDLLGLIKDGVVGPRMPMPEVLVNIKNISGLRRIKYDERSGLKVGAAITLTDLEESPIVREKYRIIAQTCSYVATPQIRNIATIGGNLCQRPWCWYFRHPLFPCFKKGGQLCYAISGEHRYYFSTMGLGTCIMAHPSDLAPTLVALDSSLMIAGPDGLKTIPISRFFTGPRDVFENILKPYEVLVEVSVPKQPDGTRGVYLKSRIRRAWDFALASAAVLLRMSGDVCLDARVVLGGLAPYPYRAEDAEERLKNSIINEATAAEAAEKAMEKAKKLPMTKYKIQLGRVIVKRAILEAAQQA